jgi:hypothetical protein
LISLQSSQQALLRVESERLSQRTTLHLILGGSFEQPTDSGAADPVASVEPERNMDRAVAAAESE